MSCTTQYVNKVNTIFFLLLGIGFTLSVLVNRFNVDDRLIGAIGCLSKGLAAFVYAFAPTEFIFYLGKRKCLIILMISDNRNLIKTK